MRLVERSTLRVRDWQLPDTGSPPIAITLRDRREMLHLTPLPQSGLLRGRDDLARCGATHAGITNPPGDPPRVEIFQHRLSILTRRADNVPELCERHAAVCIDQCERLRHHPVPGIAGED